MRAACALLPLLVVTACGGLVADESGGERQGDATNVGLPPPHPLAALRARCAPEWKDPVGGGPTPAPSLVTGRWLRCPEPAGLEPRSFVATFDALELTPDRRFFRLAIGSADFERQTSGLGDTGKWEMHGDELLFSLPACSEGYVSYGAVTACGGIDRVLPVFEASPSRMRFYGSASVYVKDE